MNRTLLKVLGGTILLAACAFAVFRLYRVSGGSMEDTIKIGDLVLMRTVAVQPERNSLALVRFSDRPGQQFIKRIVGVPGDRIRMEDKQLWVNGEPAKEPWAKHGTPFTDMVRDNFAEIVVPPAQYFVLGDNRDNSLDSRYLGLVRGSDIVAKPVLAYYSGAEQRLRVRRLR